MTESRIKGAIVLASGGTGGHLFPAQALAEELVRRGYAIHLMSDARVRDYGGDFPALQVHEIPSATLTPSKPWKLPGQVFRLIRGYRVCRVLLDDIRPLAVAGFGGYPSFPPLLAATRMGLPSLIHEQNSVMGRANRAMASRVSRIASSFPEIESLSASLKDKVVFTGNPVRDVVHKHKAAAFQAPGGGQLFQLLVFGGSQGARFFSDFMPEAIAALPHAVRKRLRIVQQCRPEDIDRVRAAYDGLGVQATLASFFADLPARIAKAHLVMARSGASTIAELAVIGRPAVLVPLPHAIDNDQLLNAGSFAKTGAGWVFRQSDLDAESFAAFFTRLRFQGDDLEAAAAAAAAFGRPDAAERLADEIELLAASAGAASATEGNK